MKSMFNTFWWVVHFFTFGALALDQIIKRCCGWVGFGN